MGRLIDIDVLFDYFGNDAIDKTTRSNIEYFVSEKGTVEAIPKTEVRKLLRNTAEKVSDSILGIVKEEYIPKTQYETRLKADLVAMLTELKNELTDISWNIDMYDSDLDFECCYLNGIDKVIQQKIDKLKEA